MEKRGLPESDPVLVPHHGTESATGGLLPLAAHPAPRHQQAHTATLPPAQWRSAGSITQQVQHGAAQPPPGLHHHTHHHICYNVNLLGRTAVDR